MELIEIINYLKTIPSDVYSQVGIQNPHSYRGAYSDLAFEIASPMTADEWIDELKNAIGSKFSCYKGGSMAVEESTKVWIANHGTSSPSMELNDVTVRLLFFQPLDIFD